MGRRLFKILLTYFLVLFYGVGQAQRCDWLEVIGGPEAEFSSDICIDENDDVIVTGMYNDTFSIGTHFFPHSSKYSGRSFLIKFNELGVVKWGSYIQSTGNAFNNTYSVNTDDNNNIYVTGYFSGDADFGNGITLTTSAFSSTFLAKYDSSGIAQWAVKADAQVSGLVIHKAVVDKADNVYFAFAFQGNASFQGTTLTFASANNNSLGVAKYSPSGVFINAIKMGATTGNDILKDMGIDGSNNIYLLAHSDSTFAFGANQLTGRGQVILKLDSSLTPIKGKKKYLNVEYEHSSYQGIAVLENGRFAVYNNFYDSVNFGNNVWLKTPWIDTGTSLSLRNPTIGLVYYDSTLTPVWARKSSAVNLNNKPGVLPRGGISVKNDNIYFGGELTRGSITLGNLTLNYSGYSQKMFVAKVDTLGNFLWAFINNDSTSSSSLEKCAVSNDGVYVTGYFTNKMSVFDKSKNGIGKVDAYVAKVVDYFIKRGYVSNGPYCAGDTIKVPYVKSGVFNAGNEFIAQLSDSAGNFDGNHRELGRSKTTSSGVINGLLPLFNVATTNKYRIRIISTDPAVQSFYKEDTLRLLIYSKDTANAGPDLYLCRGQSIRLGTTGGSRWEWSPVAALINPADSNNRQPLVSPTHETEYRIIISDSSGCGVTDTDYVKVYRRPDLEAKIVGDTSICKGYAQTLKAQATGGDSTGYWYKWRIKGQRFLISETASVTVSPPVNRTYELFVGDSCSDKIDTVYFTIKVETNLTAKVFGDTLLCSGDSSILSVLGSGCNPDKYTYEWFEKGNSAVLSYNDSILVKPLITTKYYVVLKDTSTSLVDTARLTVTVRSPLQLTINPDSTICIGEEAELRATAAGGRTTTHQIQWTVDSGPWTSNKTTEKVSPTATTTYTAVLNDGCTIDSDSATITITVRPKLKINLNADSTICIGEAAELRATTKGGDSTAHTITWQENNTPIAGNNSTRQESPSATTTYTAVLSDGCTTPNDSATITITVRPPLSISLNPDSTICVGEEAELRAETKGGDNTAHQIQWTMDKGPWTSTNPIQQVNPTVTTTYKAVLSDNCTTTPDSATLTITVRPPLQITATAPDSICSNQILLLSATPTGGNTTTHSIQWTVDGGLWTSQQNPATDTPKINTRYIATLSDNCSPTVSDTVAVTVLTVPKASFTVQPQQGCPPLIVTLTDNSADNDSLNNLWTIGNTEYEGKQTQTHELTRQGEYNIKLNVKNALGCSDEKEQRKAVIVFAKPQAAFLIKPDIKEVEEPLQLYNLSQNYTSVQWNMGDGQQITSPNGKDTSYKYNENDTGITTVQLIATNSQGCKDTAEQTIIIYDKVNCVIPTAFTPNTGDNLNPTFAPVCVGVAYYTLTIYNRWGQVIYQKPNGEWDGTYADQPVPAGVYLYKIQMQADSKKKKLTYGTVQVIR